MEAGVGQPAAVVANRTQPESPSPPAVPAGPRPQLLSWHAETGAPPHLKHEGGQQRHRLLRPQLRQHAAKNKLGGNQFVAWGRERAV